MNFQTLLRISRPRFWHYVLGPMLIYFASSGYFEDIQSLFSRGGTDRIFNLIIMLIILGYFTLQANLGVYGWNDIANGDTDKFNSKKGSYEAKIDNSTKMKNKLKWSIWLWNIGYISFGFFTIIGIITLIQMLNTENTNNLFPFFTYLSELMGHLRGAHKHFGRGSGFDAIIPIGIILLLLIPFLITSYLYSGDNLSELKQNHLLMVLGMCYTSLRHLV